MDDFEKKNQLKLINLSLILLLILLILAWFQVPDNNLHLVFCEVGQGDATLISKNYQMLVDGGPDSSVLSCLGKNMPFWDRKIEIVVTTHVEADHISGLIDVFDRYKVDNFIWSGFENDTNEFKELKKRIKKEQVNKKIVKNGDEVKFANVAFQVLWPFNKGDSFVKDLNESSVVLLGSYGKFSFLLTGDIGEKTEDILRLTNKLKEIDVLKVGHHGSKFSSSVKFLEFIKPKLAVIEVGKNRFGHQSGEVLERLRGVGARIMRTDLNRAVRVISDGKDWWVK